jgi:2-hydroxychromene-2-carboxylate isomerase
VADPLGKGVENGYAIWQLAKQLGKETEFFNAFSYAVNSQGISANYHWGLKKICEAAAIDWQAAKACLKDQSWRQLCDQNLKDMYALGLWGVPSLSYKDTHVWGQDRLFVIEDALLAQSEQTTSQSI